MAEERGGEGGQASAEASGLQGSLDRYFGLAAAGTSVASELRAGLATFLTMAYIMFVNPAILEKAGMDHGAVFVATCLAAALCTAIMGLCLLAASTDQRRLCHNYRRLFAEAGFRLMRVGRATEGRASAR